MKKSPTTNIEWPRHQFEQRKEIFVKKRVTVMQILDNLNQEKNASKWIVHQCLLHMGSCRPQICQSNKVHYWKYIHSMGFKTGLCINRRRLIGQVSLNFSWIRCMTGTCSLLLHQHAKWDKQTDRGNIMVCANLWKTLGHIIHMEDTLSHTTCSNIIED